MSAADQTADPVKDLFFGRALFRAHPLLLRQHRSGCFPRLHIGVGLRQGRLLRRLQLALTQIAGRPLPGLLRSELGRSLRGLAQMRRDDFPAAFEIGRASGRERV